MAKETMSSGGAAAGRWRANRLMRRGPLAGRYPAAAAMVLRGPICDRSALHGVLAQVDSMHLELIELRRVRRGTTESSIQK